MRSGNAKIPSVCSLRTWSRKTDPSFGRLSCHVLLSFPNSRPPRGAALPGLLAGVLAVPLFLCPPPGMQSDLYVLPPSEVIDRRECKWTNVGSPGSILMAGLGYHSHSRASLEDRAVGPYKCVLGSRELCPFLPTPWPEPSSFPSSLSFLRAIRGTPDRERVRI